MSDLIAAIGTVGFPIALVVIVVFGAGKFIDGKFWPFIVGFMEDWRTFERSRAERDGKMDDRLLTVIEHNTQAMNDNAAVIQAIRSESEARMGMMEKRISTLAKRFKEHTEEATNVK